MFSTSLLKVLLLFTIFLIPLLGANKFFGLEQTKVLFFIVSISLIVIVWRGEGFRWTRINVAGLLFTASLFLSSLIGVDPKASLLGKQPYFQGASLYAYFYLFFLAVSHSRIKLQTVAVVLTGSAFLVSLFAIKDWVLLNVLGFYVPTYAGRVVSTFGQPNFYAGFLLLALPFNYYLFKSSGRLGRFGGLGGIISIVGIFVSYSRATILLALALILCGLIDQLKIKLQLALVAVVIIFVSLFAAFKFSSGIVGNEFSGPLSILRQT